jgi:long-subunit fatty acid transport protein
MTLTTETKTTTRWATRTGVAVAATALMGVFFPVSAAQAENVPRSQEELQEICNATGTSWNYDKCSFEVQSEGAAYLDWVRYGNPVSNCSEGATQPITHQEGDVRTFSETWTVGGGISFKIKDVLTIDGGADYSQTRSTSVEKRESITAAPGRKNALTTGTEFVDQAGRLKVEVAIYAQENGVDGSTFAGYETYYIEGINRKVPTGNSEIGQDDKACSEEFGVPA